MLHGQALWASVDAGMAKMALNCWAAQPQSDADFDDAVVDAAQRIFQRRIGHSVADVAPAGSSPGASVARSAAAVAAAVVVYSLQCQSCLRAVPATIITQKICTELYMYAHLYIDIFLNADTPYCISYFNETNCSITIVPETRNPDHRRISARYHKNIYS